MKKVVLFRHGKTQAYHPSGDFFRELTPRGVEQVPLMAAALQKTGFKPDAVFTSPASRAIQTSALISKTIGYDEHKVIIDKSLYLCPAELLLEFIQKLPESFNSVLIVGHNNGMTDFINLFTEIKIDNLPTSGYALLHHTGGLWLDSYQKHTLSGTVNYPSLI